MNYNLRSVVTTGAIFFLLAACYPLSEEKAQKPQNSFQPYNPTNSINSVSLDGTHSELAVGQQHSCALRSGTVSCWGLNDNGQIGNQDGGFTAHTSDPFSGENPAPKVVSKPFVAFQGAENIAVGFEHTCAVKSKSLYCWGSNAKGQLGLGGKLNSSEPTLVPIGEPVSRVRARGYMTCVTTESGKLVCFGSRMAKKTSAEAEPKIFSKTPRVLLAGGVSSFSLSTSHLCVVQNDALKCLGYNGWGEIGDSTRMNQEVADFFEVFSSKTTSVAVTDMRSCAVQGGKLFCYGRTLGDRAVDNTPEAKWQIPDATPTESVFWNGIAPGIKVSASGAILSNLREFFYGSYFHNQGAPKRIAVKVHDFDFSEKDQNGCIMFQNTEVRCWGSNIFGQLGNGERSVSESPITQATEVSFK